MEEDTDDSIYGEFFRGELLENGEIDPFEEAFMNGYEESN